MTPKIKCKSKKKEDSEEVDLAQENCESNF